MKTSRKGRKIEVSDFCHLFLPLFFPSPILKHCMLDTHSGVVVGCEVRVKESLVGCEVVGVGLAEELLVQHGFYSNASLDPCCYERQVSHVNTHVS